MKFANTCIGLGTLFVACAIFFRSQGDHEVARLLTILGCGLNLCALAWKMGSTAR